ncbi:hypothetical protein BDV06DRAFT_78296 [Aspergillus oleicola]
MYPYALPHHPPQRHLQRCLEASVHEARRSFLRTLFIAPSHCRPAGRTFPRDTRLRIAPSLLVAPSYFISKGQSFLPETFPLYRPPFLS